MAKNDIVLLDSLVQKAKSRLGNQLDEGEIFELFAFEQILKQYEPGIDELESGWTDGGNDGGIDGFFVYLDQRVATPESSEAALRKNPSLDLWIMSVRRSPKFEQQPIDSLISSLGEILDLRLQDHELNYPFNDSVIQQRQLFRTLFIALADRQPVLRVNVIYCSRGDTAEIAPNISARADALSQNLGRLFSNAAISVSFLGSGDCCFCREKISTLIFDLDWPRCRYHAKAKALSRSALLRRILELFVMISEH